MLASYIFMCILYSYMVSDAIHNSVRRMVSLHAASHQKIRQIAREERRTIASQLEVIIDEALRARGRDPETLQPIRSNIAQEVRHAS